MHFEIVTATATAPSTGAAAAAVTGDSLTVKNGKSKVRALALWATLQATAGFAQIASPSGHDTTRGHRVGVPASSTEQLLPLGVSMPLQAQEAMSVQLAGSATAGDVEQWSALVAYDDLPGVNARLMKWGQFKSQVEKLTTIEASITSAAGPGYSGEETIDTDSNLLMANRDYAVLGMSCRTRVHAITLIGPDTSNTRIGCPGTARLDETNQFFGLLARAFDDAVIPIINSGNRSSTKVGVHTDENAGTFVVTLHLGLLKRGGGGSASA